MAVRARRTGSDYNLFLHTDSDTADTVPWTGLEAVTRASAKIIDGANGLEIAQLQLRK